MKRRNASRWAIRSHACAMNDLRIWFAAGCGRGVVVMMQPRGFLSAKLSLIAALRGGLWTSRR